MDLKSKDHIVSAKVHVVSGSLLSYQTAVDLGLLQINRVFMDSTPPCISEFKDVFRLEVGKLKGMQVKLRIDEKVKAVKQTRHRIPFHIRQ